LTTQFDTRNQIKTGFEFVYNDFDVKSSTVSPVMASWSRAMIYRIFPYRIGAYIQDKLEFEGFIANLGLRLDYSQSNTKRYLLGTYDTFYSSQLGDLIEDEAPNEESQSSMTLSPRLGISHPITENSKLYFNYGHFRSEPYSSYRFRIQRSSGKVSYIGDPNLEHEKTVAYELGYEHGLFDELLFKVAAYYKDVTNQPGWIEYNGLNNVNYFKAANNNYEDIRGLELTLTKRVGRWLTGFINYTYDVRTSGYFGLLEYNEDPQVQRAYLRTPPESTRRHPRPYARANIDFHVPDEYGPQ
jgi:outer membrane receptor protein involved in Fe transport